MYTATIITMDKASDHNPFEDEEAVVSDSDQESIDDSTITRSCNGSTTSIQEELAMAPSIRDRIKQLTLQQTQPETSAEDAREATLLKPAATRPSFSNDTAGKQIKPSNNQVATSANANPPKLVGNTTAKALASAWDQRAQSAHTPDDKFITNADGHSTRSSPITSSYQLRPPPQSRTPSPSSPSVGNVYSSTPPLRSKPFNESTTYNTAKHNLPRYNPLAEPSVKTRQPSMDNPFADAHMTSPTNRNVGNFTSTKLESVHPSTNHVSQLRNAFTKTAEATAIHFKPSSSNTAYTSPSPQILSKSYQNPSVLDTGSSQISHSPLSALSGTTATLLVSDSISKAADPPALPQKPAFKRSATYSTSITSSALSCSPPDNKSPSPTLPAPPRLLPRPATRPLVPNPRTSSLETNRSANSTDYHDTISDASDIVTVAMARDERAGKVSRIELNDFLQPDVSFPSRRPPVFRDLQSELKHIGPARCFAMCTRHVITAANALRVWDVVMGTPVSMASRGNDIRVDACCFVPPRLPNEESQWVWCALKTGELWEVEAETGVITEQRTGAHTCSVTHMLRARAHIWTLDESGRLQCWYQHGETGRLSLKAQPTLRRVPAKVIAASVVASEQLWLSTGKTVEVYLPLSRAGSNHSQHNQNGDDDGNGESLGALGSQTRMGYEATGSASGLPIATLRIDANVSDVTCITVDDTVRRVYTGHADGHVTVWCSKTRRRLQVYKASLYAITALACPGQQQPHLWAGFQTGKICVYDTAQEPWVVIKDWQAHDKAVQSLMVDNASLALLGRLQMASLDIEGCVRIWDGLLCDDLEDAHIAIRQKEFCDYRDAHVLICSWNCDARKPKSLLSNSLNAQFLKEWLTASPVTPDIIVIGFQEIIDLESKKTTAKSLLKSKKKAQNEEASRRYGLWRSRLVVAVQEAHPSETYSLLKSEHLVGLFSCMFVRRTVYDSVAGVTASMVKTGFGGRYGNKGGISMRLVINDSSICFTNCHLAAGQKEVSQRNTDAAKVLRECELEPLPSRPLAFVCGGDGLKITDHEFCFFGGDLNYRIDLPRPKVESLIADYDWAQLMENDQLCQQRARNRQHPLRSFNELPLDFIPTYKYNRGEEVFDTSEKMRIPAWCDRILHRYGGKPGPILDGTAEAAALATDPPRVQQMSYRRHECLVSDHRPISASFRLSLRHINREKRSQIERTVADIRLAIVRARAQEAMVDWLVNMGYAPTDATNALRREHWDIHAAANFLQEARLRGF